MRILGFVVSTRGIGVQVILILGGLNRWPMTEFSGRCPDHTSQLEPISQERQTWLGLHTVNSELADPERTLSVDAPVIKETRERWGVRIMQVAKVSATRLGALRGR